ncbi:fluoride efflux transporter CrcB [Desulfotruncus alcoholivorax]|uniref:fluoride efflux transporter CrcB n=1 Tax=Desulfotruncus alcoholivorax TaxID=265477 RepID=UPI0003FCA94F|nr:fluoride efflux transporter CrcB [Desulfotruncus alcoholivorax]
MIDVVAVGIGGFAGAVSRYLIGRLASKIWQGDFPAGTFMVNLTGSFALGVLAGHPHLFSAFPDGGLRVALGIGFMGSFTTFSTFMYETLTLARRGKQLLGALYVFSSIVLGLLLAWLAIYTI